MKLSYLIILLFACLMTARCKNEEVKPAVTTKPTETKTAVITTDTTHNNTLSTQGVTTHPPQLGDPDLLAGKWSLVKDSIYYVFGRDTMAHIQKYIGVEGDYYDFRYDGKVYTKMGSVLDTLSYQVTANDQVIIQKFGINVNGQYLPSTISKFTDHDATIVTSALPNPAGPYSRALYLRK